MKKFLALVLALVMTMSLVTIAGAEDFTDAADINYEEAVEVMTAVGVVGGYADGSFNPEGGLTRQAAAKIICNMILGPTTAAELDADTAPYPDVAVDSDFAGYIAYCQKEGIISGYADGTFKGANPLTGYAFMKMLLGALGYDGETEGYTGANWSINVAKKAIGEGLNAGLKTEFNGSDFVTREEACLYAFNTLKATMVEYDQQTTINVGGAEVVLAGSAQDLAWGTGTLNDGKVARDGFVQFAEKYFSKLTRVDDEDVFGRPANTWTYNKVEVGTFVDYTTLALTYTTAVDGGDVYKDLGSAAADFEVIYWVDGVMSKTVDTAAELKIAKGEDADMVGTGNGVLTEIYVDTDAEIVTVIQINTYLAEVTADYNKNKETVTVNVFGDNGTVGKIFLEDVASIVDLKADDMILVNIANDVIVEVLNPEVVADSAITKYSVSNNLPTYVTVDGEKYDSAATLTLCEELLKAYNKDALEDYTYDLYLDQYGYVVGIEKVTGTAKYLFLAGYDKADSNLAVRTADALAIFTDGTMAKIEVAFKASNDNGANLVREGDANRNTWFKYTEDDGVYTLTPTENQIVVNYGTTAPAKDEINVESVRVAEGKKVAYGNDESVYVTVNVDDTDIDGKADTNNIGIAEIDAVYTGVQEVSLVLDNDGYFGGAVIYALYGASDLYIDAAIVLGEPADSTNTGYAYAIEGAESEEYKDGYYFWDFDAVVEGVVKKLTVKDKYGDVIETIEKHLVPGAEGMMTLTYDDDGYVVGAVAVKGDADAYERNEWKASTAIDPEVYDVYQVLHAQYAQKLTAVGRTLYTNEAVDVGLTLVAGAPVVVMQLDEKGNLSVEEYTTVAAALDALEDSNNYLGVVAAELNEVGTAEYIILSSATQLVADEKVESNTKINVAVDGSKLVLTNIAGATATEKVDAIETALDAKGFDQIVVVVNDKGQIVDVTATKGAGYYDFQVVNGDLL